VSKTIGAALDHLPQGWFHHGPTVLALLEQHRPAVCVELGSWRGASAIAMARVLRQWRGTLTCVDTWTDDAIHGGVYGGLGPTQLAEMGANLRNAGVAASVRLLVATTQDAAAWWDDPIDFLFIDADHDYAACLADLNAWVPHVRPGGLFLGDDYGNPQFPGVRMAWNYYADLHALHLEHLTTPGAPHGMPLVFGLVPPEGVQQWPTTVS
jgi:hypothetical protein